MDRLVQSDTAAGNTPRRRSTDEGRTRPQGGASVSDVRGRVAGIVGGPAAAACAVRSDVAGAGRQTQVHRVTTDGAHVVVVCATDAQVPAHQETDSQGDTAALQRTMETHFRK